MLKAKLEPEQKLIIMDICDLQIQSLVRVAMDPNLNQHLEPKEKEEAISELMRGFDHLKLRPHKLFSLEGSLFSLFKHCLVNNDERYSRPDLLEGKRNLWSKIIVKDDFNLVMS